MNWQEDCLANLTAKIGSGATPRGGESVYKSSGISLIRSQNVYDFKFEPKGLAFIDDEQATALANVEVQADDVLLNITGDSIGRCCIVPNVFLPARVNQHVAIIRCNERLDSRFLLYYLNNPTIKAALLQRIHGATRKALTKGLIEDFKIRFLDIPAQRRIADILGALDDKIECNCRMNQTLEAMAQALYRHWFVDFGPFRDGEMVDSELGKIPKGWEVRTLDSVCDVNVRTLNSHNAPRLIRYIDISSMSEGQVNEVREIAFENAPSRARRIVCDGDTVWSMVRPERKSYFLVLAPEPDTIVSTGFAVISPREVPFSYLYLTLTTDEFISYLASNATGAAYPAVTSEVFERARIVLPLRPVLESFHNYTETWLRQIAANNRESKTLARTRDYLLPKLLSGEVEVKAAEEQIAGVTG
jgi:type I restriction enzyme, S subunit